MPTIGKAAPAFTVDTDTGERLSLKDLKSKPVVLYFYPKDDTPGCTTEACERRHAFPRFKKSKAVILRVSPDPVRSHQKFNVKYELPFTLLADQDHAVCEQYGVRKEKSMCGRNYRGWWVRRVQRAATSWRLWLAPSGRYPRA